jgi:hypothetical protein
MHDPGETAARSGIRGTPLRTVQITSDLQGLGEPHVYCRDFPKKGISFEAQ